MRSASAEYSDWEFRPGPLDASGEPLPDCAPAYDRLWRVTLADVAQYNATGAATDALATWPHEAGAPVVDGDGDPTNYDLAAGDRPAILGDETVWWVMNDVADGNTSSGAGPLSVEVRATAFAIWDRRDADAPDAEAPLLHRTTFYRFEITNRRASVIDDFYAGFWMDPDLGNFNDDYVGSAPGLDLGYVYNGDPFDNGAYGEVPPALGALVVQGLADERSDDLGLSAFIRPSKSSTVWSGVPRATGAYNYLRGVWPNGTPLTVGGSGYDPEAGDGAATRHLWPSTPPQFWSEHNLDGFGTQSVPGDRRLLVSSGPVRLAPEDTQTLFVALPWSRAQIDDAQGLASVRKLLFELPGLKAFAQGIEPDPRLATILPTDATPPPPPRRLALSAGYPNPFADAARFDLTLPATRPVRAEAYDVLGRRAAVLTDAVLGAGEHTLALEGTRLPPGVYVVRVRAGDAAATRTVVKR